MSLDLEGATGVVVEDHAEPGTSAYADACALLAGDVTAAVQGCLAAGADEIVVSDGHYLGQNLSVRDLPDEVILRSGFPGPHSWISGVGPGFDAAAFVAYHAKAGTQGAILDHTYDSIRVYGVELEGVGEIGEFGLAAAVCGAYGIPVVFVSGDACLASEAAATVPGVHTVAVKEGLSRSCGRLLSPARSAVLIRQGVRDALAAKKWPRPLDWSRRSLRVTFAKSGYCDAAAACPGAQREDGRTLLIPGDDFLAVFSSFVACVELSGTVA
jgi:D-amino peptidase